MVTDKTNNKSFIHADKTPLACALGTKQPPISASLGFKRKEYRARLASVKLREANKKQVTLDWEIPDASVLMVDDPTKFVHFML